MHFGTANTQSKINLRAPYQLQGYPATIMGVLLFNDQPQHILMIGLGGGDLVRFIYKNIPSIRLTTVEIHPEVVEIARAYFLVPQDDERCNIITGDGVAYIQSEVSTADILIIDAFDGSVVAEPTTTLDFYQQCARALTSNGIMVVNLLPNHTLPVYLERIKQVFNHVICLTATQYNAVVFAFKKPPNEVDSQALYEKARQLTQDYGLNFMEIAKKLTCCKIPLK